MQYHEFKKGKVKKNTNDEKYLIVGRILADCLPLLDTMPFKSADMTEMRQVRV